MARGRAYRRAALLSAALVVAGCATYRPAAPPSLTPPPAPSTHAAPPGAIVGVASWYGPGFVGKPTASGHIYHQDELTAACNVFPLGTHLMVTNLANGRSVEVLINDRGPFMKGRKIDLSHKAADLIGMLGPGTTRVSLEPLDGAMPEATIRYYVQVGSFIHPAAAERLRENLIRRYPDVQIYELDTGQRRYYRVRMGAFLTREQAAERAQQASSLGLPLMIVSE
ncbi:MAG TPA: septal ring lytic transglycosylase RlpA family protein [Candidatus Binataceae bacterium]|nr:septal ring lytic transglycosylase RlpA family protein [Candidatus Binataceae bacterium]